MEKLIFVRKGLVHRVDKNFPWMYSHTQVPFGFPLDKEIVRIYFSTRDKMNRSVVTFIECRGDDPKEVTYIHNKIVLGLGKLGMHDESGAMPSCVVKREDEIYMYYTGWNIGGDVSYRTSIGLAISRDNGITFQRFSDGPILDRSIYDPCFSCQPFVLKIGSKWNMWYLSSTRWELHDNYPEPYYHVKYAVSDDGIHWERSGKVSLDYSDEIDAVGNPTILLEDEIYKMFYSYRKGYGYRTDPSKAYRIGYAESKDGMTFIPKNEILEIIGEREEWESIANAYPHVYNFNDRKYMLYNGNGFGKSGFGYAVLEKA